MSFSIDVYHKNMLNNIKFFMKIMLLLKKGVYLRRFQTINASKNLLSVTDIWM
mgnify:CR=1 FL=1